MGKYGNRDDKDIQLAIANELAEANRLKRFELIRTVKLHGIELVDEA